MSAIVITGASRGIGAAMVRRFKAAGWKVAACSSSSAPSADYGAVCDVTDVSAVKAFLKEAAARLGGPEGKLDAIINNAGLAGANSLDPESSDELWHRIIDVNLHGAYYFCKYGAPFMRDNRGAIIQVASVLGLKGVPDQTAYCAAKHGVIGLTRSLAHALAPRRITVNAICPGWTRTEMAEGRMRELGMRAEDLAHEGSGVPLGRIIEPDEVADLAFYLAGPTARGMTGQALTLDGGSLA